MSQFEAALDELLNSPDSPVADTLDRRPAGELARRAEGSCGLAARRLRRARERGPAATVGGWTCEWQLGPLRQYLALRLVERDGERYAVRIRAMNEHRMRHLVAIANSF